MHVIEMLNRGQLYGADRFCRFVLNYRQTLPHRFNMTFLKRNFEEGLLQFQDWLIDTDSVAADVMSRRTATDHPRSAAQRSTRDLGWQTHYCWNITLQVKRNVENMLVHFEVGIIPCLTQAKNVLGHQERQRKIPETGRVLPGGKILISHPGGEY
jgi:hypothetical protein